MSLESDFFKRRRPVRKKLEKYGFLRQADAYRYEEEFMDGCFRAELTVSDDGGIRGCVTDLETGEEYLPLRMKHRMGGFVGRVRESYLEVLGEIADHCFAPLDFISDQANRIAGSIESEFGASAEFPWEKYPGNGTYKAASSGRWFALVLTCGFGKLTDPGRLKGSHEADEIVEVLNLKADPDLIPRLVQADGICPAWHMNKKHWISGLLDDTLEDAEVMELVRRSHDLVSRAKASRPVRGGAWMIPSNPKIYDVDAGFAEEGELEWHQHNDIREGDDVYIYSAAPNSALMYHCEVTAADLRYDGMFTGKEGYTRAMRLRLLEKYPRDRFPLSFMKAHGGSAVRSARRMPEELLEAILRDLMNE